MPRKALNEWPERKGPVSTGPQTPAIQPGFSRGGNARGLDQILPGPQSHASSAPIGAPAEFDWVPGLTPPPLSGLRLGMGGTILPASAELARQQFKQFRGLAFANALEPAFLAQIQTLCDTGSFVSDEADPGHREVESPQRAGRALNLVLSRAPILRWLQEVTGAGPFREIAGRVVQTFPRAGDELRWHDDRTSQKSGSHPDAEPEPQPEDDRRLALVINLGASPFAGGQFELRRKGGDLLLQHQHTAPGSLLLFRVRGDLEHRVLPLTAGGPRRVYTGWAMGADSA